MGEVQKKRSRVKLFFGLLATCEEDLTKIKRHIAYDYGTIERESPVIPFKYTKYYNEEMGENILRQWVSCKDLIFEDELPETKHHSNSLEKLYSPKESDNRIVNIDPGIVALDKLVLATTKHFAHRILMGDRIYAEVTMTYLKQKGFQSNPWTYADYKDPNNIGFFNTIRDDLHLQLAEEEKAALENK